MGPSASSGATRRSWSSPTSRICPGSCSGPTSRGLGGRGPWCETLRLSRWLRRDARGNGNVEPPARLSLRALAVIAPAYSILPNLGAAQAEREALLALACARGVADVSPVPPTWSAVMDLLEAGGYDWFHAAAHGNFFPQAPNQDSALWLQEDQALTPDSLVGAAIEGHLKRDAPPSFSTPARSAARAGRSRAWAAGPTIWSPAARASLSAPCGR